MPGSFEDIIRKNVDAYNKREFDVMESLRAPDIVSYSPKSGFQPQKGVQGARRIFDMADKAFPDLHVEMHNLMSKGNVVGAEQVNTGTNTGPLEIPILNRTFPPTNKRIEYHLGIFWTFNAKGQIIEQRSYWDLADYMRQLGLQQYV